MGSVASVEKKYVQSFGWELEGKGHLEDIRVDDRIT
jgi:hypothetical protein